MFVTFLLSKPVFIIRVTVSTPFFDLLMIFKTWSVAVTLTAFFFTVAFGAFLTGLTFTEDQMIYYTFTVVTLGLGPALIYFIKFDPTVKRMLLEK